MLQGSWCNKLCCTRLDQIIVDWEYGRKLSLDGKIVGAYERKTFWEEKIRIAVENCLR